MPTSLSDIIKDFIHLGFENTIGRYYSTYRGFVHSNEDPENLNRLQILVPHINPSVPDETWAYPKNNYAGKGYGINLIPKIGDLVWVDYEFGDPDYPVWSHGHYAEEEKPEEFSDKDSIGIKTPRGSLIIFNEMKDKESISIKLKDYKDYITIDLDLLTLESKEIKIGEGAEEWSLKGETVQKKFEDLAKEVSDIANALATHGHGGNGASPPFNAAVFSGKVSALSTFSSGLKDILSTKVKSE